MRQSLETLEAIAFDNPVTRLRFKDGTTTRVVCQENREYDAEREFMRALLSAIYGEDVINDILREKCGGWYEKYSDKNRSDISLNGFPQFTDALTYIDRSAFLDDGR